MTGSTQLLKPSETAAELAGTAFVHLNGSLYGAFTTADFTTAARVVARATDAAEAMNHHPDVALGYGKVSFTLSSHDAGGVTARDVRLAGQIQELASELGAQADSRRPEQYEIAIDCMNADAIRDFWRAGLGYEELTSDDGEIDLVDPRGTGPKIWFQQMGVARTERNRIHIDVYVPTADAKTRVAAIVAAGGAILTDEHARDWCVMADVEGNELCVCTSAT